MIKRLLSFFSEAGSPVADAVGEVSRVVLVGDEAEQMRALLVHQVVRFFLFWDKRDHLSRHPEHELLWKTLGFDSLKGLQESTLANYLLYVERLDFKFSGSVDFQARFEALRSVVNKLRTVYVTYPCYYLDADPVPKISLPTEAGSPPRRRAASSRF